MKKREKFSLWRSGPDLDNLNPPARKGDHVARGEGFSVYKPSGRKKYRIKYKDHKGLEHVVPGFRDKTATIQKARELVRREERIAAGLPVTPDPGKMKPTSRSLTDLIQDYGGECRRRGLCDRSIRWNLNRLAEMLRICKWKQPEDIRTGSVLKFLGNLTAQGRAGGTVNNYRASIIQFVDYCVAIEILPENPLAIPKARRGRVQEKRAFTQEEFKRITTLGRGRDLIYLVLGLSGLRRAEAKFLRREELDPTGTRPVWKIDRRRVKVRRADVVPMLPECAAAIQGLWEITPPGGRIWPQFPTDVTFEKDLRRAGIPKKDASGRVACFHSFRYFFCTALVQANLPIQLVQRLMRHKNIQITMNLYLDLGIDQVAQALENLPSILDSSCGTVFGTRGKDEEE